MAAPNIAIVNSSSFGRFFTDHLERLNAFASVSRLDVPITITAEDLADKLQGVNGIIASVTPKFPRATLEKLSDLVILARHGIGCDNVDIQAAADLGIPVTNVPGPVERHAVAEHAIALMLSLSRHIVIGDHLVHESRWAERAKHIGTELHGKTIGLIGIGNLGSRVAEILRHGFGSRVVAYDPLLSGSEITARSADPVDLETLLRESHLISLHSTLTPESRKALGAKQFAMMRKGVLIVNTARGELLDEDALVSGLESGHIAGYATDVVEGEPIKGDHRLLRFPNVIIVPHLGGYTHESLRGMGEKMVVDMEDVFVRMKLPTHIVNPASLSKRRVWP